jgi:hypothetical protein
MQGRLKRKSRAFCTLTYRALAFQALCGAIYTSSSVKTRLHGIVEFYRLLANNLQPSLDTPDQFTSFLRADMARWAKIVRTSGIKVE